MQQLKVAFVWHMHQPWYVWPSSGEAALPFVRLHAYGAYLDMPWLVRQFDKTTVTFNLVPSLMAQIKGYATGEITDRTLELCRRPATELTPEEQTFLLTNFTAAHPDNMRNRSPRYTQLSHMRGLSRNAESIEAARRRFTVGDFRDLQVWLNLACCGYALRHENELVRELWIRDRDFSEHDKVALLEELQRILHRIPSEYLQAQQEGFADLSTSPYYHAILPLLVEMNDATRHIPRENLPQALWKAPEEAQAQLGRARTQHREFFGEDPVGLWPSEGAISEATLELIEEAGFGWTASDEEVLLYSLDPQGTKRLTPVELYQPYRVADGNLTLVFRDHHLSDRIGFVYRDWAPADAVADFMGNLVGIASGLSESSRPPLVCVILDGENAWGTYPDGGERFLRTLYEAIEREPSLETVSVTQYTTEYPPTRRLASIFPGSWIDHSYRTWIGGPEHKRAWSLLGSAYEAVKLAPPGDDRTVAHEYLMRAEGSDWFWWYSEFHHDEYESIFDQLFRANLAAVYRALGLAQPPGLEETLTVEGLGRLARDPTGAMEAIIDGRVTSYFEWQAAGSLRTASLASTMHRSDCLVREIHYGFDATSLYLRIDTTIWAKDLLQDCRVRLSFVGKFEQSLVLYMPTDTLASELHVIGELAEAAVAAADTIVELRIAVEGLPQRADAAIEFAVVIEEDSRIIERWPTRGYLHLQVPTADALAAAWLV
ncbi:MAG: glycoside hydrolase family 57 protein [Candidatus Zipacnadales bacterium]